MKEKYEALSLLLVKEKYEALSLLLVKEKYKALSLLWAKVKEKLMEQVPVCECDDWQCRELLGISWDEWLEHEKKGILVAANCATPIPPGKIRVEVYDTFYIIGNQAPGNIVEDLPK
jgi:hypothetical protein